MSHALITYNSIVSQAIVDQTVSDEDQHSQNVYSM